jgi:hypothetical protein
MSFLGLNLGESILPTPDVMPRGPGLLGPDYSFADNLPLPGEVGVRDGDSMDSVIGAVKGVGYYVDMIGFGQASSGLTTGVGPNGGPRPLGVNTWMRTGLKCSNGADMWVYNEGVPTGNALGERVKDGLASAGLPPMRGLAPGILEDAQSALDPRPILSAVFGSGYPRCKLVKKKVGDQDGNIEKPLAKGEKGPIYYVENNETVVKEGSDSYQSRWAHDSDLTESVWEAEPKVYCPDGVSLRKNYIDEECKKANANAVGGEGFRTWPFTFSFGLLLVLILGGLVFVCRKYKKEIRAGFAGLNLNKIFIRL